VAVFLRFRRATPIGEISEGATVIVEGKVAAKTELNVPEAGRRCVWYDVLFEAFSSGSRGGRMLWLPDRVEAKCAGFFVEDATGKVWVPEDAQLLDVQGAHRMGGPIGKDTSKRYVANYLEAGDTVRIEGRVDKPAGRKEPAGTRVLRPVAQGKRLTILLR
jgi:hypothetical protein